MRRLPLEVFIGWLLAASVHPIAAWRVLPRSGRFAMMSAYFAGAFVATLSVLLWVTK